MAKELALGAKTRLGDDPLEALRAVQDIGMATTHLSYPAHLDSPEGIERIKSACAETGVEITSFFCGFPGESYADIPTVRRTVGLVPEGTRAERVARIAQISAFCEAMGVTRIGTHIGFIPEDPADPLHAVMVKVMQDVCDTVATRGQVFALETGQETAAGLRRFILDVDRPNLRVNFDPANMILYGSARPIPALDHLAEFIDGVHCKDGLWPTEKDKLGEEVPLGEGEVDIPRWLERLVTLGYRGPLTIEREISGEQQMRDIARGGALLESVLNGLRERGDL